VQEETQQLETIYRLIVEFFVNYSFQFFGALLVLAVGIFIASRVAKFVRGICERKELDHTLSNFLANISKLVIVAMVSIVALGKIGISIGPFVAAVGALSLGAGLAVQGLLSNYGAGLAIIVTRPFVIGDTISVQGVSGVVAAVGLATTLLADEDGVEITIPNRHIVGEILHNSHAVSLVELGVGIRYDSDPQAAIDAIQSALETMAEICGDRIPVVGIDRFGDNSIDLGIRFWGPTQKLFQLRYRANSLIHAALAEANITIPFPQREVRLLGEKT
jgi:small conductance mechanosensitive channel